MEKGNSTSRKRIKATKKLVPLFQAYYQDFHKEEFFVNYPMVRSAEKVASYYEALQVTKALDYYFSTRNNHDLWEFINDIDKFYTAAIDAVEKEDKLQDLIAKTNGKMRKIERRSGIDNEDT